jgi:hypothetical protein
MGPARSSQPDPQHFGFSAGARQKNQLHPSSGHLGYLQISVACPVNVLSLAEVAVMVTGFMSAVVHVAVTCLPCFAESWTEGSLAVQFALTIIAVLAVQGPLPANRLEATKSWPLAGAAAAWSTWAEGGATRKPTSLQSPGFPALATDSSIAATSPLKNTLYGNMIDASFRLDNFYFTRIGSKQPANLRTQEDLRLCAAVPATGCLLA